MNILCVDGSEYVESFRSQGHRVAHFARPPGAAAHESLADYTLDHALAHCAFEPDLIVVQLFGPRLLLRGLESCPYPLAARVYDSSFNHFWLRHYLALFDHVFVDFESSIPRLAELGIRAHWLPYSVDEMLFAPLCPEPKYAVGFVGVTELRPRRQAFLELLRAHFEVEVAGAISGKQRLRLPQLAEFYSQCQVVVNECLFDGINFRVFEAMAAGACLVTESTQNGLPGLFRAGDELVTYEPANLIERVAALLADSERRSRIARSGRQRVLSEHTHAVRSQRLLELVAASAPHGRAATHARQLATARTVVALSHRWPHTTPLEVPRALESIEAASTASQGRTSREAGHLSWTHGILCGLAGDASRALTSLNRAVALLLDEPLPLLHLAALLEHLGQQDLALRSYGMALLRFDARGRNANQRDANRRDANRQDARGQGASRQGASERAREALSRHGIGAELWLALADLLHESGEPDEPNATGLESLLFPESARDFWMKAWRQADSSVALIELARSHSRAREFGISCALWRLLIAAGSPSAELLFDAAIDHLQAFERKQGLYMLSLALRMEPGLSQRLPEVPLNALELRTLDPEARRDPDC